MPLKAGASKATVSQNIREFHTGKTYAHTAAKFGKERANKQAIAVALNTARKYKADGGEAVRHTLPDAAAPIRDFRDRDTSGWTIGNNDDRTQPQGKAFGGPGVPKPPALSKPVPLGGAYKPPKETAGFQPENMERMVTRGSMYGLRHEGMINSSVPGRTDKLPMNVKSGSYILPADIPSALGQGNTMAGGSILKKMFSSGPYGMTPMKGAGRSGMSLAPHMNMRPPSMPRMGKSQFGFAEGGTNHEQEGDDHVPIIAAGGEYIIHPDVVRDIGHGDIKAGHRVLDKFVLSVRKKHIETLKKLKPPKK